MARLFHLWRSLRASLWFVPGVIVLLAVGLAVALIDADGLVGSEALAAWPRLFGAGAAGARAMLTVIAGSMVTVAGVVFSITLVALSLASSQYTSRVLRNFMSDRTNQTVLGVFVGVFAYCLVVLRTIREGVEGAFVPSLAVLGGVVLAFVGIAFFIYFIHHIATSIQASHILARIAGETVAAVEHLFPDGLGGEQAEPPVIDPARARPGTAWRAATAPKSGYVQVVDASSLLAIAAASESVVRMEVGVGDFAIEGLPIASILGDGPLEPGRAGRLRACFTINHQRSTDQDAAYGIRQIVDVALKALSPGVNDTTTAVMALDYLAVILTRLARRRIESPYRRDKGDGGALRVIAMGPSFESLAGGALNQIRQNAGGNIAVLDRLLGVLETVERLTASPERRRILLEQAAAAAEVAERTIPAARERGAVLERAERLISALSAARGDDAG